ncbi:hypothetical protein ACFSO7_16775 [Bacillus sp. CGMCC 1.16607]|uniref:hypothetical protein n=1 Tax=Bacillus sp. CGMCC 1.16607 TaxID=3351842 RepID=UPI00364296C5
MMEDQLKNMKSEIKETTFKDFQFDASMRQAVFQKIKENDMNGNQKVTKKRNHHRFRGFLTAAAYGGMLTLIVSIVVNYMDEPSKLEPGHGKVIDKPVESEEQGILLTKNEYESKPYSFKLSFPENWLNKVSIQKLDYGVRFFYTGIDGYQQDLFTIGVQKVEDHLKFIYEGGPDTSKDIGVLGENVYRHLRPLDNALSLEEDIKNYGELMTEIPSVIESFSFTKKNSGLIEDTPFLYGFTPHYNQKYGFEVNLPKKWQNLYEITESNKEMKFIFQKEGAESTEFLTIKFFSTQEWEEIQSSSNEKNEYGEIARKDGTIFAAKIIKENPFEAPELFYPLDMLIIESNAVLESFQFLD